MHKIVLFAALSLALLAPNAFAQDPPKAALHIRKFRQVTPSIYAGGNPVKNPNSTDGLVSLVELGIATNINLQGGDVDGTWTGLFASYLQKGEDPRAIAHEKQFLESYGVLFFNFPLNSHAPKTSEEDRGIREALALMAGATPEAPVYIHCEHGADRTGLLIALYRVVFEDWPTADAYAEWVKNGHTRTARLITGDLDIYFYSFVASLPGREVPAQQVSGSDCQDDLDPNR